MKILYAQNSQYNVYKISKRVFLAENRPGFPRFHGKFTMRSEVTTEDAEMLLKTFLCPDKTEDAPAPDA